MRMTFKSWGTVHGEEIDILMAYYDYATWGASITSESAARSEALYSVLCDSKIFVVLRT